MNESDDDKLMRDHEYDGIQEYDNNLPRWWVYKFLITIAFAVVYMYWMQFSGSGKNIWDEYMTDRTAYERDEMLRAAKNMRPSEEEFLALAADPLVLSSGELVFKERCASCHGLKGEGIVGPNLTDHYWIHGGSLMEIANVVEKGVPEKGMVPWKGILKPDEIYAVIAYVHELNKKGEVEGKAAEGEFVSGGK
ncbi:MAG: hypothetical protein COV44_00710 [Deltaproteobacteria bacterium CG11_big_fil_rev_8_21_14_0_20_45_16]|nr:MAG: hypothetical protein COV44_00710 [Deltaproteobacteria bacterium CG11_big_fil_rev_8_21_14_0_20_45_16]